MKYEYIGLHRKDVELYRRIGTNWYQMKMAFARVCVKFVVWLVCEPEVRYSKLPVTGVEFMDKWVEIYKRD